MPTWCSLYFQNRVRPIIEQLIIFHDHTIIIIIIVMVLVGYILMSSLISIIYNRILFQSHELERIWTLIPAVFLLFIAFPSLRVLYLIEEIDDPELRIKVIGHQWYWRYEYGDVINRIFDSYMISEDDKPLFRLLNVDNSLILPYLTKIRIIISRVDVIHSWTLPSVGVRVDAIPGRLNQIFLLFNRVGVFTGQCSEICGANHRFIPIIVNTVTRSLFLSNL